jgi:small-conductance mechanosensitive channel
MQLIEMGHDFVRALPNIAIALVVLLITWLVARFATRIASVLTGRSSLRPSLSNLINTLVRLAIWLVGLMVALVVVMPGFTPASVIAGAWHRRESRDKVIRAIKRALDEARIEIPFPYVTHTFKERVPVGREPGEAVQDRLSPCREADMALTGGARSSAG